MGLQPKSSARSIGMMITRRDAVRIVEQHPLWDGFTVTDQTETEMIDGKPEWVESGTSFDEMMGIRSAYSLREVRDWLGY